MKRSRFTEEQIVAVLKEHELGAKPADLARKHGVSEATLYNSKAKYGGLTVSDAKRLRALSDENAKLKNLLADTMLDNAVLKDISTKNVWSVPSVQGSCVMLTMSACINVSSLSRVDRCCGQAMMRSARFVPR